MSLACCSIGLVVQVNKEKGLDIRVANIQKKKEGTWYYYLLFFFAELFVYTIMIVCIGSALFQWRFFCGVAFKMWSWLLPEKLKKRCAHYLYDNPSTLPV